MAAPRVLGIILAGGKGSRLYPLTRNQVKPAVHFGGKYRIVDFVLSNFINSGIFSLYVLVQYRSLPLIEHLRTGWRECGMMREHFLTIVPPQLCEGEAVYRGTADAIAQNAALIHNFAPDVVAVFSADHVFRMDIQQMVDFHLENRADVTVAAMLVSRMEATRFGVIECDLDSRITRLTEKPQTPPSMPGSPDMAYASMGNFLFRPSYLLRLLERVKEGAFRAADFSADVLPEEAGQARMFAYNSRQHSVPGDGLHEAMSYWRDVGTISSYFQAHMDLLCEPPRLDLDNPQWPIHGARFNSPPTHLSDSHVKNALIAEGCHIQNASLHDVVIGRGARIEPGADIRDSVIMDNARIGRGVRMERCIVDSRAAIEAGSVLAPGIIECDAEIHVDETSQILVVPRSASFEPAAAGAGCTTTNTRNARPT